MADRTTHPVLKFIRGLRPTGRDAEAPDEHLLARFASRRDEAAFAELVRRHGPMVYGVCARALGDSSDAEDACQATSLVLAHRAASVSRPWLLANWLHGVARRTALKARGRAVRRRAAESGASTRIGTDPADDAVQRDLRRVLD